MASSTSDHLQKKCGPKEEEGAAGTSPVSLESLPRKAKGHRLFRLGGEEDHGEEEAGPLPREFPSYLGALTGREKVTLYCDDLLKGCKVGRKL